MKQRLRVALDERRQDACRRAGRAVLGGLLVSVAAFPTTEAATNINLVIVGVLVFVLALSPVSDAPAETAAMRA